MQLPRSELTNPLRAASAGWHGSTSPIVDVDPLSALDGVDIEPHPDLGLDLLHLPGDDVDLEAWAELIDLALEDS